MFSEIIFSESSLQTVIFAVGASRVTVWRAEVSIVALSGIAMMLLLRSKPCEGEEGWKGLAPLKSTFPVNNSFLILSAYHELFNLISLIVL